MIKLKDDISNNISFPSNQRKIMVLIDGNYYRLEIVKVIARAYNSQKSNEFKHLNVYYFLYREQDNIDFPIASANLLLCNENSNYSFNFGFKERPKEYFELESIKTEEKFRNLKLGTPLLSYIMNDVEKFNKLYEKDLKILIMRMKTKITEPFYKKFGARNNSTVNPENSVFEYMIVDKPKVVGELPLELADDFDYAANGYKNPFENVGCGFAGPQPE